MSIYRYKYDPISKNLLCFKTNNWETLTPCSNRSSRSDSLSTWAVNAEGVIDPTKQTYFSEYKTYISSFKLEKEI